MFTCLSINSSQQNTKKVQTLLFQYKHKAKLYLGQIITLCLKTIFKFVSNLKKCPTFLKAGHFLYGFKFI
ncbi:MAG: hypothetical protein CFE21_06815 [Bacteroidetes bacterium B1(2017)]|nr:MAG: hypothetical protein CFE21_06815 [Bacteroidetes bacterium B1(2017)]